MFKPGLRSSQAPFRDYNEDDAPQLSAEAIAAAVTAPILEKTGLQAQVVRLDGDLQASDTMDGLHPTREGQRKLGEAEQNGQFRPRQTLIPNCAEASLRPSFRGGVAEPGTGAPLGILEVPRFRISAFAPSGMTPAGSPRRRSL